MRWKYFCCWALLLSANFLTAESDDLLARILAGSQQAQTKFNTVCGKMTETRTSPLMSKPMVLKGKFCTQGSSKFSIAYSAPHPMQLWLNGSDLTMTTDKGKTRHVDIGRDLRRVQATFNGKAPSDSLKKDFAATEQQTASEFEVKLVPRAERLHRRINSLDIKLDKQTFLPRMFTIVGSNGVTSVFVFDVTSMNAKLPAGTFNATEAQ